MNVDGWTSCLWYDRPNATAFTQIVKAEAVRGAETVRISFVVVLLNL